MSADRHPALINADEVIELEQQGRDERGAWLIDAATLLAEPDPGPTPWLIEDLVIDRALVACVGQWKTTKSYAMLELAISVVTGEPAFGELAVTEPGQVVFVIEESGRDALWRRLDALSRGRAIERERLRGLHLATNERVKLDDADWQGRLIEAGLQLGPRLFIFDPLARMKAPARDENAQGEMAAVIEFLRLLRDQTGATVAFVHHTGHAGHHMRGSSDLESAWESRLAWTKGDDGLVELASEHREAETGPRLRYRISWDADTRTIRFPLETLPSDLVDEVGAELAKDPVASGSAIAAKLGRRKQDVLRAVSAMRSGGSGTARNHPSPAGSAGGSPDRPPSLREGPSGTTGLRSGSGLSQDEIEDLGTVSLDELRRRHETGEL